MIPTGLHFNTGFRVEFALVNGWGAADPFPNSVTVNPSFIDELDGWAEWKTGTAPDVGWSEDYAILHRVDSTNYNALRQTHELETGEQYQITTTVLGEYNALVRVGNTEGGAQIVSEYVVNGGETSVVVFTATEDTVYLQIRSQANLQDTPVDLLMIEPYVSLSEFPDNDSGSTEYFFFFA